MLYDGPWGDRPPDLCYEGNFWADSIRQCMKTVLICHKGANLSKEGMSRWLASFSDLVGIVVLEENRSRVIKRIKREIRRVGVFRFLDVLAFRIYYRLWLAAKDGAWEQQKLSELCQTYDDLPENIPLLHSNSPNSREAEEFISTLSPDIVVARCKTLLKPSVFSIPKSGTLVMHPGICPEYRNAHGCFWALVNRDLDKVGMTLLRIDSGVDTGPIYGHFTYEFDELKESHIVIQNRVVFDNLDGLKMKIIEIHSGSANIIPVGERSSAMWGQPWLTKYVKWKQSARRKQK